MRTKHITLIVLACALLLIGGAAKSTAYLPAQGDLFEKALAQVNFAPEDVRISPNDLGLWGGNKYQLKLLNLFQDNPWKISAYSRSLGNGILKNLATVTAEGKPQAPNLGAIVTSAHQKLDCGVRLGLTGDALAADKARIEELGDNALAVALSELTHDPPETYSGVPLKPAPTPAPAVTEAVPPAKPAPAKPDSDRLTSAQMYAEIPPEVRDAAALVLFAVPRALRYRDLGLTQPILALGLDPQQVYDRVYDFTISTFEEEDNTTGNEVIDDTADMLLLESLMDNVDWNLINTGAALMTVVSQDAEQMLAYDKDGKALDWSDKPFDFAVRTPLGIVSLHGSGQAGYEGEQHLLALDTDGDDSYSSVAAIFDYAHPVSICIDMNGDDKYQMARTDQPSSGAGIFGYGILIDAAGADSYRGAYAAQGCGIFGTGLLADYGGNDDYYAYGNSQASGSFGTGLLIDVAGDDRYEVYKYSQGFGGTRGSAMLIDCAGNDVYYANMKDHFNGGLYGPTHHVHFCQGSAFGRRADFTDGHSWAGGFALLLDGGGDDSYEGDCYVQGNSYWYAVGMLIDKGGNDVYRAGQYSQASAPHFACGILQDEAGDDRYVIGIRQSMGHGRDWSLAWFEDAGGNDWYQGARTTLGVSHVNALSFFWDRAGDDTYIAKGPSFGESEIEVSGSPRDWLMTLGMFVDGGGKDRYYLLPGDESYEGSNTFTGDVTEEMLSTMTPLDFAGDGKMWVKTAPTAESPGWAGVGIDAE